MTSFMNDHLAQNKAQPQNIKSGNNFYLAVDHL